jgi:hypothetical protein
MKNFRSRIETNPLVIEAPMLYHIEGDYFALNCYDPQMGKIDDKIAWRFQQRRR